MNNKIKAMIVDDEYPAREIVSRYVNHFSNIEIIAECNNGFEALKKIGKLKPDILFLDIQMPKLNGFEMLELIENPPVIIFTTAYDQHAIKAFEVNAVDYLLKPFSQDRFNAAVKKAFGFLQDNSKQKNVLKKLITHHSSKSDYLDRIIVKTGNTIKIIEIEKLIRIEAQDDYVMLYTGDGKYLKQKTMKYFEEHLDPNLFIRIHRSHIVKLSLIKQLEPYTKGTYQVILHNRIELPISKSGYQKLKEHLE
jgi:two-component system LytT family response regulator